MTLPDQLARDRFALETGQNFSVIAPAGVGKTTAIALRVAQIALADVALLAHGKTPRLPRLAVVTYTRKAADELRDRARAEMVKAKAPPVVLGLFNEAFFGTIHSFCVELVRRFGPLAGLPARFTIAPDDAALRLAFQRDTVDPAAKLPVAARACWQRYGSAENLWPLVWSWPAGAATPPAPGAVPTLDFSAIIGFAPKRKDPRVIRNIEISRERLRRWQAAGQGARALGLPEPASASEEFVPLWNSAFQPLREWLAAAAAQAAAGLAEDFLLYKLQRGVLGYEDLAPAALRLLRDPAVAPRVHAQGYSILLDEAQDTDPAQFALLLAVAQAKAEALPAPGRFSMVGDPQQSIYNRAEVKMYLALHQRLQAEGAAEPLVFSVTMRCDEAVVAHANARFAEVLHEARGQVGFVPLIARPGAGEGGVWRLPIERPADFPAKPKVEELRRAEAQALAAWLSRVGYAGAGADGWEQVAILAPRREWLEITALALAEVGLEAQLHSSGRMRGADPARAWLGALLGVLADPGDIFEKVGVLREIFGIADDDLYYWRQSGPVAPGLRAALTLLDELTAQGAALPLRDAVALAAEAVRLRERLEKLSPPPLPGALENLLGQAVLADARGETLAAFARTLLRGPAEAVDAPARPGAIQLLTNQKAKGLEWQTVIQFGLFLEPKFHSPEYPCWRPVRDGGAPGCIYDPVHAAAGGENSLVRVRAALRCAEFERLLYVAATRPRHSLILLDAESLAAKPGKDSLATLLGITQEGAARKAWQDLPEPVEISKQRKRPAANSAKEPILPAQWPQAAWSPNIFSAVLNVASKFTRRVRPSTLAHHGAMLPERAEPDLAAPPEYPEEQAPASAAVAYGNWWHQLMEDTPWSRGRKAWQKLWAERVATAPEPERARVETALLLNSPLAEQLTAPGLEFAAELPFLWAEPKASRAFDGCVDLAAWDTKNHQWLIVDWKTDRTEGDAAEQLRKRYGPQIQVYARALAAMTGARASAVLYGTRTGALAKVQ